MHNNIDVHNELDTKQQNLNCAFIDYRDWNSKLQQLKQQYRQERPFPHIHLRQFLDSTFAKKLAEDFPGPNDDSWIQYRHLNSKKLGKTDITLFPESIKAVVREFQSPRFLTWLSQLTGIDNLIADPGLEGGGLHQSIRGGFLNVHTDFNLHYRNKHWERRVNLLLYLNEDWQDSWNGHLELWDKNMTRCEKKIAPLLNDVVIFSTTEESFHGHPEPLQTPEGITRKSIALYYFTDGTRTVTENRGRATNYKSRPQDSAVKRALLWIDRKALSVYHHLRVRFKFTDKGLVSRILKGFNSSR